ncbi:hypothetical protein A2V49_03150 [candidate division WWE3 bacterium RBG_19FT_COMBO_34_6]|uniref:histidine kinase n=1 Tax=candidate division WWE3 bacterium RBG_19FT_COMBO_34_6 TaxID=1802612 RepID=A0A1F4UK38_UNCKA|nr:MAG: hypothetical protein A2V49_03150 [candidate division WWE3 bacterium RBG_19FT_COMBO_34_6]
MFTSLILLTLVFMLVILVFYLFYLFLKKDQSLLELKAKYEHLKKNEDRQLEFVQQREDYEAMMVHELRSPLSVIRGSADLIKKESEKLSLQQKDSLLTQIFDSCTFLLNIVNDILDVSKIESGRFEIKKSTGNLNSVLQQCVDYYTPLAQERDIKINTEFDTSMADFKFDQDAIMHVMGNLLSNAIKFNKNKGAISVISKNKNDGYAQISVSDTGFGIPDDMKMRLFNKFVQVDNNKKVSQKGTGLGLVIAKGIVESHSGKIWIENNSPEGAVFKFTIPIKDD